MEKRKKRKYDTIPEIYMSENDAFFRRHYPIDAEDGSINAVRASGDDFDYRDFENTRIEHNL